MQPAESKQLPAVNSRQTLQGTDMDIKELALKIAEEMGGNLYTLMDRCEDFATRFLAAITEKAEPVALYPCGFKNLHSMVIEKGAFLARNLNEDEPVTDGIRSAAMVLVGYAKDMSTLLAKQSLYTHPAIEPAGEVVVTTTEEGRCVCVTRQDEEGRILKVLWEAPAIEPAPQQASRDLQHEHTMNQFKEVCHGRNCTANKAQPTHSAECKADHDNAVGAAQLPDAAYMPKICVDPDAWATTDNCVGPNLGKVRYDKLPIQSLNPLQYTHEKMYSHRSVIGLMKAAYYDGYSEREKEVRATESAPLPDEVARMVATLSEMCWDECDSAAKMIERLARQVPEGCVVVPREPTEAMLQAGWRITHEAFLDRDKAHPRHVYVKMIAAGEVKP